MILDFANVVVGIAVALVLHALRREKLQPGSFPLFWIWFWLTGCSMGLGIVHEGVSLSSHNPASERIVGYLVARKAGSWTGDQRFRCESPTRLPSRS